MQVKFGAGSVEPEGCTVMLKGKPFLAEIIGVVDVDYRKFLVAGWI
jgi:hypothetical protein